jgi:hypothetical protein
LSLTFQRISLLLNAAASTIYKFVEGLRILQGQNKRSVIALISHWPRGIPAQRVPSETVTGVCTTRYSGYCSTLEEYQHLFVKRHILH